MDPVRIGVIGGSGLYQMPELQDIEERQSVPGPYALISLRKTEKSRFSQKLSIRS